MAVDCEQSAFAGRDAGCAEVQVLGVAVSARSDQDYRLFSASYPMPESAGNVLPPDVDTAVTFWFQ